MSLFARSSLRPAQRSLLRMAAPGGGGFTKPAAAGGAKGKKGKAGAGASDSRYAQLQEYLLAPHRAPDAPPSEHLADVHATIERAWAVTEGQRRAAHMRDLDRKYARMREAMLALERADPKRFKAAMDKHGEEIYFPRLLKAPTETPARAGWDGGVAAAAATKDAAAGGHGNKGKAAKAAKAAKGAKSKKRV